MKSVLIFLAVLLLVVSLVAGASLADPFDTYDPIAEAQAERIRVETEVYRSREAALQPVKVALHTLFGGVGILVVGLAAWAGFLYLRRRACTVYPAPNGVMPAVILRQGEFVVDLGALAGPLAVGSQGPSYRLPAAEIPHLQAMANQGAAATRTMRAWATREVAAKQEISPWPALESPREFPPVEVLTGDESHVLRLLEDRQG